jgi:hypothetical protein
MQQFHCCSASVMQHSAVYHDSCNDASLVLPSNDQVDDSLMGTKLTLKAIGSSQNNQNWGMAL